MPKSSYVNKWKHTRGGGEGEGGVSLSRMFHRVSYRRWKRVVTNKFRGLTVTYRTESGEGARVAASIVARINARTRISTALDRKM